MFIKINLHSHSTCSDGVLNPKELIVHLAKKGVTHLALTDHDTLAGLNEAKLEAKNQGIVFINGVEFSTKVYGLNLNFLNEELHTIHLLGLGFNAEKLQELLDEDLNQKERHLFALNQRLISEGYQISLIDKLNRRTTLAMELIKKGYEKTTQQAFQNVIGRYYDRTKDEMTVTKVVNLVHQSGGEIYLAHPFDVLRGNEKQRLTENQVELLCKALCANNLDGIETYYQNFDARQIKYLEEIAKKKLLKSSIGTDFHGKRVTEKPFYNKTPFNLGGDLFENIRGG